MSKFILLLLAVVCTVMLLGCSKSETTTNREGSAAPTNKPAAAPSATAASMSTSEKIGVPECDEFIAAYQACISDKVPAAAKTQFNASLALWKKTWHDQAASPQAKAALVQACKTAADQAHTSMKAYNCKW